MQGAIKDTEDSANENIIAIDAWMVYGWKEIQEATQSLRGTDASEKVMADLVVDIPDVLLDLISRRELIVAKIPPPLPRVMPDQLASNDGSIMDYPKAVMSSDPAKLPPLRRPVWVGHGRNVYDVTSEYFGLVPHEELYSHKHSALRVWGRRPEGRD